MLKISRFCHHWSPYSGSFHAGLCLYHCIFNIPVLLAFPPDCTACSLSLLNSIQFPESIRATVDAGQRGSSSSELGEVPCYPAISNNTRTVSALKLNLSPSKMRAVGETFQELHISENLWALLNVECFTYLMANVQNLRWEEQRKTKLYLSYPWQIWK